MDLYDRSWSAASPRIPLWLKVAYTGFIAVLVPVYWAAYGPANFLFFCDLALFFVLAAIWLESPLLASMPAVGTLAAHALWIADFVALAFGGRLTGMTAYMFDTTYPLHLRALSLFHLWLPPLLLYLVWRLGYDRRAFWAWTVLAGCVLLVSYFVLPPPSSDPGSAARNINYVYGFSDTHPQMVMPSWAWLMMLMAGYPLLICAPVHLALRRWMPQVR